MNYSTLTKTQRTCIDAFVKLDPSLASAPSISRKHIEKLFWELHAERINGGEKIGYPMWLVKGEKVGRGEYRFPAPELKAGSFKPSVQSTPSKSSKEDEEFFAELAEEGVLEEVV